MILNKLYLLVFFCGMIHEVQSAHHLNYEQKYESKLTQFFQVTQEESDDFMHQVPAFFLCFDESYKQVIKTLHHDIAVLAKEIKNASRQKNTVTVLQSQHDQLKQLYKFIKKYRFQYEMVQFHQYVKNYYNVLFQALAQGKDVALFLNQFDIDDVNYESLREFAKMISKDLRTIETYEYRLHADWVDLKLANYVLKIELIRLRNAILFHPLYKKTKLKLSSTYPR